MGMVAVSKVPPPAGLATTSRPRQRLHAVGEPDETGPTIGQRAADPVVADEQGQLRTLGVDHHRHLRRARVLGRVGRRLRDDVVGGDLDGIGQSRADLEVELTRSADSGTADARTP